MQPFRRNLNLLLCQHDSEKLVRMAQRAVKFTRFSTFWAMAHILLAICLNFWIFDSLYSH